MTKPPTEITVCHLEVVGMPNGEVIVVVMPNGEVICAGKSHGWIKELGKYIREIKK
jgi:hypothetical protein